MCSSCGSTWRAPWADEAAELDKALAASVAERPLPRPASARATAEVQGSSLVLRRADKSLVLSLMRIWGGALFVVFTLGIGLAIGQMVMEPTWEQLANILFFVAIYLILLRIFLVFVFTDRLELGPGGVFSSGFWRTRVPFCGLDAIAAIGPTTIVDEEANSVQRGIEIRSQIGAKLYWAHRAPEEELAWLADVLTRHLQLLRKQV